MVPMASKKSTPLPTDKDYTPREAGMFLKITPETVKMHCRKGSLKARKVGSKKEWRISGPVILQKMHEWNLI